MTPSLIRAARAGLGWSQEKLAAEARLHPKSVAYWEGRAASRNRPKPQALDRMAEAFARAGLKIEGAAIHFPE